MEYKHILKIQKIKTMAFYLAEHCFGLFLVLTLFALICNGFVFYKYSIIAEKQQIQDLGVVLKFQENIYQDILEIWSEQERKFDQFENKQYPSLFQKEQEQNQDQDQEKEIKSVD